MSDTDWALRTLIPDAVAARRGEVRWTFLEVPGMYLREYRDRMFWSAFPENTSELLERVAGDPGVVASVPFSLRPGTFFSDHYEGYAIVDVEDMDQAAASGRAVPDGARAAVAAYRQDLERLFAAIDADGRMWIDERLPVPPQPFWWLDWAVAPWRGRRYFRLWHPGMSPPPAGERALPGC